MSIQAMSWVMDDAPVENTTEMVVLYVLANHARKDGTCSWPSHATIADNTRCSRRTVIRHIKALEQRGLIYRGDQRHVGHLPADKRPVVWNLNMTMRREMPDDAGCQNVTPQPSGVTSSAGRGDSGGKSGVTSSAERGDTGVTQTVLEPSVEPSLNHPPTPKGDDGASAAGDAIAAEPLDPFEEWWEHVPRKKAKGDARKAFNTAIKKTDLPTLIAGIEASKRQWQSEGRDSSKLPYPATWLRAESWEDEQDTWQAPRDNSNSLAAWGAPSTRMNTPTQQQTRFPSIWDLKEIE